jgi:hypothetical protein
MGPFKGATPGGTTWHGSLYDYWCSDIDPAVNNPLAPGGVGSMTPYVRTATWDGPKGLMSDHVATLLRIV